tara:strand:+ start:914 stop:1222 length:309 start_codon:yes stop_codon:yes gene_type:complete
MTYYKLLSLKEDVENLDKFHQIKIFEIFYKNKIPFTENRNGIFINITELPEKMINEISDYLLYVKEQNNTILKTEKIKNRLEKKYFKGKDNKDNTKVYNNDF